MQYDLGTVYFYQVTGLTSNGFFIRGQQVYFYRHSGCRKCVLHGICVSFAQHCGTLVIHYHKMCGIRNCIPGLSVLVYGFHISLLSRLSSKQVCLNHRGAHNDHAVLPYAVVASCCPRVQQCPASRPEWRICRSQCSRLDH